MTNRDRVISTIKLSKETKEKLINLDISRKDKSFEEIILELIEYYGGK
jgi:hypothetical protein